MEIAYMSPEELFSSLSLLLDFFFGFFIKHEVGIFSYKYIALLANLSCFFYFSPLRHTPHMDMWVVRMRSHRSQTHSCSIQETIIRYRSLLCTSIREWCAIEWVPVFMKCDKERFCYSCGVWDDAARTMGAFMFYRSIHPHATINICWPCVWIYQAHSYAMVKLIYICKEHFTYNAKYNMCVLYTLYIRQYRVFPPIYTK